jgi:hypothetical protein
VFCDETPFPKFWLEEKSKAKPERQKAAKDSNELAAICLSLAICRLLSPFAGCDLPLVITI